MRTSCSSAARRTCSWWPAWSGPGSTTTARPLPGAVSSHVLVPSSVHGDGLGASTQVADAVTAPPGPRLARPGQGQDVTAHSPSTVVGRPSVSRVCGMAMPSTSTSPVRSCARTQRDEPSSPTSLARDERDDDPARRIGDDRARGVEPGQPAQHRLGRRQHGHPARLELGQCSCRRDPRRDVGLRRRQPRPAVADLRSEEPDVVAVALHLRGHPVVDDRQDGRVDQQPALVVPYREVDADLLQRSRGSRRSRAQRCRSRRCCHARPAHARRR